MPAIRLPRSSQAIARAIMRWKPDERREGDEDAAALPMAIACGVPESLIVRLMKYSPDRRQLTRGQNHNRSRSAMFALCRRLNSMS